MWEVVRDGVVVAYGPEVTMPDKSMRQQLRAAGYDILLDGKKLR